MTYPFALSKILATLFFLPWGLSILKAQSSLKPDWLLDPSSYVAQVKEAENEIVLTNGLISRTIRTDPNAATVGFENLISGETLLRGVKPEAEISLDGKNYPVGGLTGQPNYAFLKSEWIEDLQADPSSMQLANYEVASAQAPFDWKRPRHHAPGLEWPPKGIRVRMVYEMPSSPGMAELTEPIPTIRVTVFYELYDGIPVYSKWIQVHNFGQKPVTLDSFASEIIAAVEYGSDVESREYIIANPNLHVETDFAFSSMYADDANHHVVHWEADPEYLTQVNYRRQTNCLLRVSPEIGPSQVLTPGDTFTSFRTYVLAHDSYDRERMGLAQRRMYRVIAPWSTENPLMMHARFADWDKVKIAIDQASEAGFEMVILTFGSGFNIEDESPEYLSQMKEYSEYARSKGVEIGGYSLLASRSIGPDDDVVMREGEEATFGNSPCIGSEWGQDYFRKLYQFYQKTGFTLLEHDGSYPGDPCLSEEHPGHKGFLDSRWNQYQVISDFYKWCRGQGIYLNIPDYYYLTGGNKCGMGYRETNWSLPREQQVIHTRQNIYDGTWTKLVTMGWMFVPLTEYHGGGEAATIEPLNEHLDHYQQMMASNLGAGVQACYRGPRLFDTPKTKKMVTDMVEWYKKHREVLEGDLIHLRRADGRDLDYWLLVKPNSQEKGALVVFNPLDESREKDIRVPLYYTGLTGETKVIGDDGMAKIHQLDRGHNINLTVDVAAQGWKVYFFE